MQALEGCVGRDQVKKRLTEPLCENLMATGFYDVKIVSNDQGEHAFVTAPAAIHKFVDTMVDDAFDLAKALVAALTYGIATSDPGRGRIMLPSVLLNKLVAGHSIPRRPVPGLLGNSRTRASSRALPA